MPASSPQVVIRAAHFDDVATIAQMNCLLAWESEQLKLDLETVRLGVATLVAEPPRGRYFVAVIHDQIVGQILHTFEWSDWRNGEYWWIQSVYVRAEFRQQGIFRRLLEFVEAEARRNPLVVALRLYVAHENEQAQETYRRLGLQSAGYEVFERTLRESSTTEIPGA